MIGNNSSYWGITKLKEMIHKMPNMMLIIEWRSIRVHNDSCPYFDYSNCNFCSNREQCYQSLTIEEVLTEELIDRGLFDFALKIGYEIKPNAEKIQKEDHLNPELSN